MAIRTSQQPIASPTQTATREQPISGHTLTVTPWGVSWKLEARAQWSVRAQPTWSPHPDGYSS